MEKVDCDGEVWAGVEDANHEHSKELEEEPSEIECKDWSTTFIRFREKEEDDSDGDAHAEIDSKNDERLAGGVEVIVKVGEVKGVDIAKDIGEIEALTRDLLRPYGVIRTWYRAWHRGGHRCRQG